MDITVKGWLKKQPVQRATGGGGSALKRKVGRAKRRYFVLFQGLDVSNLVYFTNEKCVKEKGRLVVGGGSTVQARLDGSHSFELVDRDGNIFVAQADTSSDASVWVRVIQQAISQHRGTSGAGSAVTDAATGAAVSTAARAAGPGSTSASAAASSSSSSSSSSSAASPAPASASAGDGVSSAVVLGPAASGPNGGGGGGRGVADAGLEPGSEEWVAQLREMEAGHQKELLRIRQQTADVPFHDRDLDDHGGSSDEDGDDELLDPKTIQALALKVKLELELDQARAQLAKHGHEPIEYRDDSLDVQDQQDGGDTEIGAAAALAAPPGTPGNRHTVGSVPMDAAATAPAPEQQPTAPGLEERPRHLNDTDRVAAGNGHAHVAGADNAAGADSATGADNAAKTQWLRTQEQLARLQSGDARAPAAAASASASLGSAPAAAARDRQRPSGAQPPASAAAAAPGNEDAHALRLENLRLQDEIKRLKQSHAETMAAARARERELAARVTTLEQQLTNLRLGGGPAEDKAVDSNCKCTVA